jgi:hypothetical protein
MIWRCGVEQDTQPDSGTLQNNTRICNKAGANPAAALNIPARIPFRVADSAPVCVADLALYPLGNADGLGEGFGHGIN